MSQPIVKISIHGGNAVTERKSAPVLYEVHHAADFETDEDAVLHAASALGATHVLKGETGIFALVPKTKGYDAYLVYYFLGKWHIQRVPQRVDELPLGSKKIDSKSVPAKEGVGKFTTVERNPKDIDEGKALGEVRNASDVYRILHQQLSKESQELFIVIPLDIYAFPCCKPIEIARGQKDRVNVDSADILSAVLAKKGSAFIVVHNHPSTEASPSDADKELTAHIREAAAKALPSVPFLDHVVIGASAKGGEYYSFAENKLYKVRAKRR